MSNAARKPDPPVTVEDFCDWVDRQDTDEVYELYSGEIVAMVRERVAHLETKFAAQVALRGAIREAGLPCHMLPDGATVPVDAASAYVPDALVYCGAALQPDDTLIEAPVIVVEVRSPSTARRDIGEKLIGYFKLPSLRHYLVLLTGPRTVIHFERTSDGQVATRFVKEGEIRLDPPGLALRIEDLFQTAP